MQDDKLVREEIEVPRLEHAQVPKVVLQPPSLGLGNHEHRHRRAVGHPPSSKSREGVPRGDLEENDVREHGGVEAPVGLEHACILQVLPELPEVGLDVGIVRRLMQLRALALARAAERGHQHRLEVLVERGLHVLVVDLVEGAVGVCGVLAHICKKDLQGQLGREQRQRQPLGSHAEHTSNILACRAWLLYGVGT
jgi:hypothetical protein